jgi:hypothetical protein
MDKELIVVKGKVIEQQKSYTADSGKDIGYEAGAKMVKRHFDENPDDVIAQFTGRNHFEKILSQSECVGIRTFYGLNELGIKTLIFVGVDKDGRNIIELEYSDKKNHLKHKAVIINGGTICPPNCDNGSSGSISWW